METLDSIYRRIKNANDLRSIVRTMKTLAAVSIRQYERAMESLEEYNQTIEKGFQIVLRDWPQDLDGFNNVEKDSAGVIIFGSDQGMCGQFNDHIVLYALYFLEELQTQLSDQRFVCVGVRAAARMEEAGIGYDEIFPLPGSVTGITSSVQRLLITVDRWRSESGIQKIYLFYNHPVSGSSYQPKVVQLLPFRFQKPVENNGKGRPSRSIPIYTMDHKELLSALIRQYLFASIFRTYAASLTSENTSRLLTMQSAEKNIDEKLDEFTMFYHGLRQSTITNEILDIISGLEALSN